MLNGMGLSLRRLLLIIFVLPKETGHAVPTAPSEVAGGIVLAPVVIQNVL